MPELGERERRRLVLRSYLGADRTRRSERRALALAPVPFCRRLRFEGWENLHDAAEDPLFLLAPLGSLEVASRVVELYHEGRERTSFFVPEPGRAVVEAQLFRRDVRCSARPAQTVLARRTTAVWVVALAEKKGRWGVGYLPPVSPAPNDTAASLTHRFLDVLEARILRSPDAWPWWELG